MHHKAYCNRKTKKDVHTKQNIHTISGGGTYVGTMRLSHVKTAIGVMVKAKLIFVVDFYLYLHCPSHRFL